MLNEDEVALSGDEPEYTEIKPVFKNVLSEDNIKVLRSKDRNKDLFFVIPPKEDFLSKFKKTKKEINNLFNIKGIGFNQSPFPRSFAVRSFKKGMTNFFFGPKGILTNKLKSIKKIYKNKVKETSRINAPIHIGPLTYLELKSKNSTKNRIDEFRKFALERSQNFCMTEANINNESQLSTSLSNNHPLHNCIEPNKRKRSSISLHKKIKSIDSNRKGQTSTVHSRFFTPLKKNEFKSRNDSQSLSHNKSLNFLYSPLKEKNRKIRSELIDLDHSYYRLENSLYKIVDKVNRATNEILGARKYLSPKLKRDIIVLYDAKYVKKGLEKTEDIIKEAVHQKKKEEKYNISKVNNETALLLADKILNSFDKSKEGKFYIPKKRIYTKYNFDNKLRNKCNENFSVIEKMTFSLDKLKRSHNMLS